MTLGIGLANLRRQYEAIGEGMKVQKSANVFTVDVPLVDGSHGLL